MRPKPRITPADLKGKAVHHVNSACGMELRGGAVVHTEHVSEIEEFHGFPALRIGGRVTVMIVDSLPALSFSAPLAGQQGFAVLAERETPEIIEMTAALGLERAKYAVEMVTTDPDEAIGIAVGILTEMQRAVPNSARLPLAFQGERELPSWLGGCPGRRGSLLPPDEQFEAIVDWMSPRTGFESKSGVASWARPTSLFLGEFESRPAVILGGAKAIVAARLAGKRAMTEATARQPDDGGIAIFSIELANDPDETALILAYPFLPIRRFTPVAIYRDWFSALFEETCR